MKTSAIAHRAAIALMAGGFFFATAMPALTQSAIVGGTSVIGVYQAFLGTGDHYNSSGQRLTQPWQIIRQDRANYHRFGRGDKGDDWDSFFDSASNRARMESMLRKGHISPAAARAIVDRNVWITVEILGYGNKGTAIRVTVQ